MSLRTFAASILLSLYLTSCCSFDPTCHDQTSLSPSKFWHPVEHSRVCHQEKIWPSDETTNLSILNRKDIQIADLLDLALYLNPNTQLTWANARAAAYNVEVQKAALYPTVEMFEQYNISDVRYDDGNPNDELLMTGPLVLSQRQMLNLVKQLDSKEVALPLRLNGPGLIPGLLDFQSPVRQRIVDEILAKNSGAVCNASNLIDQTNVSNVVSNTGQAANAALASSTAAQSFGGVATGGIGSSRNLLHDLSISYLLLDFGGRQATIEAARQALYSSDWIHNRQIQQVIIVVLRNYFNVVGLISLLEARQSDLNNARVNAESARQLFEAGIRNKLDVLQAESDLINIELTIVDLEQQLHLAYGNLANAIGLPAHVKYNVPEFPDDLAVDVSIGNIDDLIQRAIQLRPDLAATYAEEEQRRAEVTIARSQGLPTINTQMDLRSFNDTINPSFNTHAISGGIFVNIPIFNGFLFVNQERRAKELVRAANANARNTELLVTLDVLTSYYSFKASIESLRYSEDFLQVSSEAYEAALATYQEGIGTILDLLAAQRSLAEAKARRIQARTNWAIALSNISFAVGTLGSDHEIKPWEQRIGTKP